MNYNPHKVLQGIWCTACALIEKKEEEQSHREAEEIEKKTEMDIMFFYYSWYNNIPYEKVVELYKKDKLH